MDEIRRVSKDHELKGFEICRSVWLEPGPYLQDDIESDWEIGGELITSTGKLRRGNAKVFANLLNAR